ncbi:YciI family protein [Actinomadura sp. NPDC048955]|uniref:YciI family protein n=1 Tax=Actinomadura sp. NPDC048955 TaxID=3158228 RepID=UPI0033DABF60
MLRTGPETGPHDDEETTVKYMLMIYNRPGFLEELTEQERTALFGEVEAIMTELSESGELVGGAALADPSLTRTVAVRDGRPAVTDGPFLEAKEHFAGYVSVDCDTEERALEIAARWPDVKYGGYLEVRAIMQDSGTEM